MARGSSAVAAALLVLFVSAAAHGQGINPGPPGPFVIDLRGATSGVPSAAEFYPVVDDDPDDDQELVVPARGFGFDIGAHVYPFRIGPARIGFGVTFGRVRATAVSALPAGDDDSDDDSAGDEGAAPQTVDVVGRAQI